MLHVCDGCGSPYQRVHPKQRVNRCEQCMPGAAPNPRHEAEYLKNRAIVLETGEPCFWCGADATTADHVKAVADGGRHNLGNLVPACGTCNSRRGGERRNPPRSRGRGRGSAPTARPAAAVRLV